MALAALVANVAFGCEEVPVDAVDHPLLVDAVGAAARMPCDYMDDAHNDGDHDTCDGHRTAPKPEW
ncbi:MAG: hypothetical protein H0X33_13840 [Taibaiella sp.]|nr:hypothetical protein [Taibaiella sp.]